MVTGLLLIPGYISHRRCTNLNVQPSRKLVLVSREGCGGGLIRNAVGICGLPCPQPAYKGNDKRPCESNRIVIWACPFA